MNKDTQKTSEGLKDCSAETAQAVDTHCGAAAVLSWSIPMYP